MNAASTPHRAQSPPGLSVVLFSTIDTESRKAARQALAKVKGVSRKGTQANVKRGEINIKLSGDAKVSVAGIVAALKDAGIEASIAKATE